MGKLELNKRIKRESLLDSAFSLFTSKGFTKTSISDIVEKSGIAKGTFYLYFKDKYDIRNKLISHKAGHLFDNAEKEMLKEGIHYLQDQIIFICDNIINQLCENKSLLRFIAKNLSWGMFKNSLGNTNDDEVNFADIYNRIVTRDDCTINNPEIMLFMIIELVSSTCYSSILYNEPVPIDELKPYIFDTIRDITKRHIEPEHS